MVQIQPKDIRHLSIIKNDCSDTDLSKFIYMKTASQIGKATKKLNSVAAEHSKYLNNNSKPTRLLFEP